MLPAWICPACMTSYWRGCVRARVCLTRWCHFKAFQRSHHFTFSLSVPIISLLFSSFFIFIRNGIKRHSSSHSTGRSKEDKLKGKQLVLMEMNDQSDRLTLCFQPICAYGFLFGQLQRKSAAFVHLSVLLYCFLTVAGDQNLSLSTNDSFYFASVR